MGWFTATTSCGDEVLAAYRGRNSEKLRISNYDGEWETENTTSQVKSDISLAQINCQPEVLYLAASEQIKYKNQNSEEKIADSAYSRHSIDTTEDRIHTSYYNYGEGIYYAQKQEGEEWNTTKLTNHSNTDQYNDIAVDKAGNIHLVFAQNSDIIHAEKNTGKVENLKQIQKYIQILFGTILVSLIANLGRKPEVQNQIIQLISKIR
jgi:hypothetical protein